MKNLKKCPFCGGKAGVIVRMRNEFEQGNFGSDKVACVQCVQCKCKTGWYLHTPLAKIRAIEAWNKRVGETNE